MAVSPYQAGEQQCIQLLYLVVKNCPIQAGEQQSPCAVFHSTTVVGEEALGEDIQQLLQPIVSYSVQYNQQHDRTLVVLHSLTFSMSKRRRTRWKGVPVIYSDDVYTVNQSFHTHFIYTLRHSIAVAWSECTVCNCKTDSLTGVAVLQI